TTLCRFLIPAAFGLVFGYSAIESATWAEEKQPSNLRAAAAKIDITPPDGTPVVGHVREVSGVRDPLHATLLLLDDSRTRAAIVALDLINAGGDMTSRLREGLSMSAEIPPE